MIRSLIATALVLASACNINAQPGHLSVQGEAVIAAQPELVVANIPIQAKSADYEQCAQQLTSTYNALSAALVKAGIEKDMIRSNGLNISENYTWVERERKLDGYLGNIQVSISMPHTTQMLNAFMRTLNDERFNFGYNLGFAFSDAQREAMQKEAVTKAVADAKTKAVALAEGLGVNLLHIHEVSYGSSERRHDPIAMRSMSNEAAASMEQIEIHPSDQEIRRTVQITWAIGN